MLLSHATPDAVFFDAAVFSFLPPFYALCRRSFSPSASSTCFSPLTLRRLPDILLLIFPICRRHFADPSPPMLRCAAYYASSQHELRAAMLRSQMRELSCDALPRQPMPRAPPLPAQLR